MWRVTILRLICLVHIVLVQLAGGQDTCPPFSDPENGMVIHETDPVAAFSTAMFSCNDGYILVGSSVRLCRVTGQWIGEDTSCTPVVCNSLDSPTNGNVNLSNATFMSVATYSCNAGHLLEGNASRTCQSNGSWSGTEPTCVVSCGPPPTLENGVVDFDGTTINSPAQYSCNVGYNLVTSSSTIRFCMANGAWFEADITCQIVTCPRLFSPSNGLVTFTDSRNFGSLAVYSCIPGFEVVGTDTLFCQLSGEWNGTRPSCERVDCGVPPDVDNGGVSFGLTTFQSLARYECDDGFLLVPPEQELRTCTAERVWSGSDPICEDVDCGSPSTPGNGTVEYTASSYLSTANYTCLFGYELIPAEGRVRVCEGDGLWSGPDPTCILLVQCPDLASPNNGQVTITSVSTQLSRTTGSTALYQCTSGYSIQNNQTRVCEGPSGWSGEEPTCEDIDECVTEDGGCGQLCVNTDGSFRCECEDGFTLSGDAVNCDDIDECTQSTHNCDPNATCSNIEGGFTCSCNDGFQGDGLVCKADCGVLPQLFNGMITYSPNTVVGGVARHSCNSGFVVQGGEERVCQTDGQWSPADISCLQVVYVEFAQSEYTALETENLVSLSVLRRNITARTITVLFSTRAGTAMPSRDYSERTNVRLTFPPLTTELTVNFPLINGPEFRGNVTVYGVLSTEEVGVAVGPETLVTIIDDEPPNEECVTLESPENGRIFINGTQIGDTVSYQCDLGFNLVGEENRTCNLVGLWTGRDPTCQIVDCGPLSNSINGTVTLATTTYLSTANYSCGSGFRLEGTITRECTVEGEWSPEEPVCVDVLAICKQCSARANCVQLSPLQYGCECVNGFEGDGFSCNDIDECALGMDSCDDNAVCHNTDGGYSCSCRPGYSGGGFICENTDECSVGLAMDNCHPRAICTDTVGSFTCACRSGFEGDGFQCVAPPCSSNFQLAFDGISCSALLSGIPQEKIADITAGVRRVVNTECQSDCQLLDSQVTNAKLDCTIADIGIYRATINITNEENCTQLIEIISNWVATDPSLLVQSSVLRIASYCEVEFESFDVRSDCVEPGDNRTRPTMSTQTTEAGTDAGVGLQLTMVEIIAVSAVGGGAALLLILALLVICCVFAVRISRIKNKPSYGESTQFVEGASASNDALFFRETPSQRRKRKNKPTYEVDGEAAQFTTFNPSSDPSPALRTSYLQMTTPIPSFQDNTVMHNQGVADLEFSN